MNTETLLTRYNVDVAHARHVADLALALFDGMKSMHKLPNEQRDLLETGALLHNVGLNIDQPTHHIVGRDIILGEQLPWLDERERAILACMVAFHRKKVRPAHEPAYLCLGKKDRQAALRLSALLRIADGFDYSQTQTTRLHTCKVKDKRVVLHITGPHVDEDGPRAEKKADLWEQVLDVPVKVAADVEGAPVEEVHAAAVNGVPEIEPAEVAEAATVPETDGAQVIASATVAPEDSLAEAGRRLLRSELQTLLAHERGARKDRDIEDVHKMRVATRRMRAILKIIEEVAPVKRVRHFRRELREVAQALSPVRDGDVFLLQLTGYIDSREEREREGMNVLLSAVRRDREEARKKMLAYFGSERYDEFKQEFAAFLTDNPDRWNTTLRVCDRVGSMLWQRFEALRAHDTDISLDGPIDQETEAALHETRITGKRLRYVLETFADAFGSGQADNCIKPLKSLQDHLGDLQDIAVARAYIAGLTIDSDSRPVIDTYLDSREQERTRLLTELPERWMHITGETYRRDLAQLLIEL